MECTLRTPAKVNLCLDVVGKRADGYHLLRGVMQTVSLYDTVTVRAEERGETSILVGTDKGFLPADRRNTAFRAAELFTEATGLRLAVGLSLRKMIPVGAGLGGGSSDAAAVLRALNGLFGEPLCAKTLHALALQIGADVPFFLEGGTCLAEGVGEVLTRLRPFADVPMVICKPRASLSTKLIFSTLNWDGTKPHPDTEGMLAAIAQGNREEVARCLGNVLEPVSCHLCPEIGRIRNRLTKLGAEGVLMSGSGTAVFGLFHDRETAQEAVLNLRPRYPETYAVHTTADLK